MSLPVYSIKDLSDFSNFPTTYFSNYANTTLSQASLLFMLASCLNDPPEDPQMLELMQNGILDMALKIYISNANIEAQYNPFSSETIGSYSYSIAATRIRNNEETGVMWFDLAISKLGVCDWISGGAHSSGGIEVFEGDGTFVPGYQAGNERLLSPNDITEYPNATFWR